MYDMHCILLWNYMFDTGNWNTSNLCSKKWWLFEPQFWYRSSWTVPIPWLETLIKKKETRIAQDLVSSNSLAMTDRKAALDFDSGLFKSKNPLHQSHFWSFFWSYTAFYKKNTNLDKIWLGVRIFTGCLHPSTIFA